MAPAWNTQISIASFDEFDFPFFERMGQLEPAAMQSVSSICVDRQTHCEREGISDAKWQFLI